MGNSFDLSVDESKQTWLVYLYAVMIFLIVNVLLLYSFIYNYKQRIIEQTSINIHEYEEVDLSHLCQMTSCVYIKNNSTDLLYKNVNFGKLNYVHLVESQDTIKQEAHLFSDMHITNNLDVWIDIRLQDTYDGFVVVSKKSVIDIINNIYYYILLIAITANIVLSTQNVLNYKRMQLRRNLMLQHEGYYKSIMVLTENIHHELNTPLYIINNKVQKIKHKMQYSMNCTPLVCAGEIDESLKDFELVESSLIQITDLLSRMRPFKDIKHQTNRDLKAVITTSCDVISVSQHEKFMYTISDELSQYKVDGSLLKNGELTAILLNFIKNSIDANSIRLQFNINDYNEKDKLLSFYIVDDGNGIPSHMQSSIFNEHISSKALTRGQGLYVNKYILNHSNGDVSLIHSSNQGTIFLVTIPVTKI